MNNRNLLPIVAALLLPTAALADVTATATMADTTFLNLSTGSTNINGADIGWKSSTGIFYQGNAKGLNLGQIGSASYAALTQAVLMQFASAGNVSPIPPSTLAAGDVFAVEGNTGNFTKAMVTGISGGSITFQYTTFGANGSGGGGGPTPPTITSALNNSSTIPLGFPNSGITASSLVHIVGQNMATPGTTPVLQDSTKGLPMTLNGTTVSIAVGSTTLQCPIYYSSPTDVAIVIPAKTPTGSGTITVSYNNQSANTNVQVVASAFGFDVYDGNTAVATDNATGALITYTNSAKPGEVLLFWGDGVGADPNHSDTVGGSNDTINMPATFYFGGVQAQVAFTGTLYYPGVQGFAVTVPAGTPTGCFVPVVVVTGSGTQVVSSTPTLPVMPNGSECNDPLFGVSGSQISALQGKTVRSGSLIVGQLAGTTTTNLAEASFDSTTTVSFGSSGTVSVGSCVVSEVLSSGGTSTSVGLDAGPSIGLTGPAGNYTLNGIPSLKGDYLAQLPSGAIPSTGGTYTFTGPGGADVGSFTTSVTLPNPLLVWTNQSAAATVTRSQGLNVAWTGGASGSFVFITGSASANGVSGSYTCIAPQSAGQFNVPSWATLSLPAGTGTTAVENLTAFGTFSASGLDRGSTFGFTGLSVNSTYQ